MWNSLSEFVYDSEGVPCAQCVWDVLSVCGMASVGLDLYQRVWHVLSGRGMAREYAMVSMGVAWLSGCGMASVAVA